MLASSTADFSFITTGKPYVNQRGTTENTCDLLYAITVNLNQEHWGESSMEYTYNLYLQLSQLYIYVLWGSHVSILAQPLLP